MELELPLLALCVGILLLQTHGSKAGEPLVIDRGLLDAICQVESGGDSCAIGDKSLANKAYGLYQIRAPYYTDAVEFNPSLKDNNRDFTDVWGQGSKSYSEDVMESYMGRYATPERLGRDPTDEDIARIHNGGPNGYRNPSTEVYWEKVQAAMNRNSGKRKRQAASCTLVCDQGECCGETACNCLDSSLMVVPCDSLESAAAKVNMSIIKLMVFATTATFTLYITI